VDYRRLGNSAADLSQRVHSQQDPRASPGFHLWTGQFELRVNGSNVSDAVMEPSWTNYTKNCHYVTYDVTKVLVQGSNAMGVLLGNGMYNVPASSRYAKFTGSFGSPKLILRLQMEFTDGSKDAVVSDTSWTRRPVDHVQQHLRRRRFDARQEPAAGTSPGSLPHHGSRPRWPPELPALIARSAPPVK